MLTLLLIATCSFGVCMALTPAVRSLATRVGLVDRPDRFRKLHSRPTPTAGGIAILISAALTLAVCLAVHTEFRQEVEAGDGASKLLTLLLAGLTICAVGVVDDLRGLRGVHKLVGQTVAVAIVMSSGLVMEHVNFFGWTLDLGPLAMPVTAFWLLAAINSLNLIDGMDGLLTSVGLIILATMGAMAFRGLYSASAGAYVPAWAEAAVAAALVGSLLAFLRFNFPPASIFLGDSGSMLIGLVVGTLALQSSLKGAATVTLSAPLALLALPLFDTAVAIIRRKLTDRSIYATDRGHLHHCLLRRGFSKPGVLLIVSCLCSVTALAAMTSLLLNSEALAILTVAAVFGIMVTTRLFGYVEFVLVKERLKALVRAGRKPAGQSRQLQVRLQGSLDWGALWGDLTACAEDLQLDFLCLDINAPSLHEGYHARWWRPDSRADGAQMWHTQIPLYWGGASVGRLKVHAHRPPEDRGLFWTKMARLEALVEDFAAVTARDDTPLPAGLDSGEHAATAGNRLEVQQGV
jgi:UDP-GlcNAc:undecaprenyl-phosphate GlcNAc-1-phosphate transferase